MGYAIIQTGGKQYRVEPGRFYDVELLACHPGTKLSITDVLFVHLNGTIEVGCPLVTNAAVDVTVMKHFKAKKVLVYKMRPKKKTRKKNGHRQQLTRIMVDTIRANGATISAPLEPEHFPQPTMEVETSYPAATAETQAPSSEAFIETETTITPAVETISEAEVVNEEVVELSVETTEEIVEAETTNEEVTEATSEAVEDISETVDTPEESEEVTVETSETSEEDSETAPIAEEGLAEATQDAPEGENDPA